MQFHKYSLQDVENLIPFEREIYSAMLVRHLEEQEKKLEEAKKKRMR